MAGDTRFGYQINQFAPVVGSSEIAAAPEVAYDGVVARLLRGRLQKILEGTLESELQHLKAEAERSEHSK